MTIDKDLLNLGKSPLETRVVVAMSGGVDSSVVAALLKEAGYDVIGLTMQLYDQGETAVQTKTCCAGQDIYDARAVADQFGFPHYVLDYESRFKHAVMEDFADSYLAGETPIPCIKCNQEVKFKDLLETARDLGGEVLATGHYLRWVQGKLGPELHRALDSSRDQSYFLFNTTSQQLDYLRFPLGSMLKSETRAHAERLGLNIAQKPDSQDICFVPNGNYAQVVERLRPGALEPGQIIHVDGTLLGSHQGIINYTVGQRRGLNISSPSGEPLYVIKVDPVTHQVIAGPRQFLSCTGVTLREVNWLVNPYDFEKLNLHVKVRSSQLPISASYHIENSKTEVNFLYPEYGISPGQACVIYEGDRVIGGGWISQALTFYDFQNSK